MQAEKINENTIVKISELIDYYPLELANVLLQDLLAFYNKNLNDEICIVRFKDTGEKILTMYNNRIIFNGDLENKEKVKNIIFSNGDFGFNVSKEDFGKKDFLKACRIPDNKIENLVSRIGNL